MVWVSVTGWPPALSFRPPQYPRTRPPIVVASGSWTSTAPSPSSAIAHRMTLATWQSTPNQPFVMVTQALATHPDVDALIVVTGRDEIARRATEALASV